MSRPRPTSSQATLRWLTSPLMPALHSARSYDLFKFRRDLVAGLTVAVVEVPQAMAYAVIAGVPPVYGLYTSIIQGIIGALLSSSEHLTTGPTNTQSLLIASAVHRLLGDSGDPAIYLELVFGLTMLKGTIQLAFAGARMGELVRYVSRSVIVGVAAGAGVLILVGQLPNFLGVDISGVDSSLPGIAGTFHRLAMRAGDINGYAVAIGTLTLALILGMRLISRFFPAALVAIVASGVLVFWAGWSDGELALLGPLPRGLPQLHVPQITLEQAEGLFSGAVALAILGMLESVAIVKTIARHTHEKIDPNQEFFAQGFKNLVSSFLQCIPGSGSFTRSSLDFEAGAQTRFAAVYNSIFVAIIFLVGAELARFIPMASLAAVLFVIGLGLVDWHYIAKLVRYSRSDAVVGTLTFLATIILPLEYAIFVGIFLSLALYLRKITRLHMAQLVPTSTGQFREMPVADSSGQPHNVVFLQIEGDLFFGVADDLQDHLTDVINSPAVAVILRLKRTHSIDATSLDVVAQFGRDLQDRGGQLILCGVKPDLMRQFERAGLLAQLGKENVFQAEAGVFTSAKQALRRASEIIKEPLQSPGLDDQEGLDTWAFEI